MFKARAGFIRAAILAAVGGCSYFANAADPFPVSWSYNAGSQVVGTPSIGSDGTVYFTTLYAVFALHPDGMEKWVKGFDNSNVRHDSVVPLDDGSVVYVRRDGWVTKRDSTGEIVWTYQPGSGTQAGIAVSTDGTIYHGSGDGNLYATNPDGTLKWSFAAGNEIQGGVDHIDEGTLREGARFCRVKVLSSPPLTPPARYDRQAVFEWRAKSEALRHERIQ